MAMSDENGNVHTSTPGLANAAHVTTKECEAALSTLSSPDKYSKSKEKEGRRIEEIDGGYHIINRNKYRDIPSNRKEYWRDWKRRQRAAKKAAQCPQDKPPMSTASTVDKVDVSTISTQTKTKTEKEYSYIPLCNDIETKDCKDIYNRNIENEKNNQGKDFVSISRNNVDMQKLVLNLTDLFAIHPDTADYTAICNLARQALPEHFPAIIQTALKILETSTIKKPLAMFFHTLKRENIYNANAGATQ